MNKPFTSASNHAAEGAIPNDDVDLQEPERLQTPPRRSKSGSPKNRVKIVSAISQLRQQHTALPSLDEYEENQGHLDLEVNGHQTYRNMEHRNLNDTTTNYPHKNIGSPQHTIATIPDEDFSNDDENYVPYNHRKHVYAKSFLRGCFRSRQGKIILFFSMLTLFLIVVSSHFGNKSNVNNAETSSTGADNVATTSSPTATMITEVPTSNPSISLSTAPSVSASSNPSSFYSSSPSNSPSNVLVQITSSPTPQPSVLPTKSNIPSSGPSKDPTMSPTTTMERFPACDVPYPELLGNGVCNSRDHHGNTQYNTRDCGYDAGDCIELNQKYPDCHPWDFKYFGNGVCDRLSHSNHACGFEDGGKFYFALFLFLNSFGDSFHTIIDLILRFQIALNLTYNILNVRYKYLKILGMENV